ncbi:hypothetical protein AB0M54_24380 [Actinoplanes sp. NPDC051470]|uniref:hypothetical protein n=1 Tax=Actinoplanes sp. NPDC051470 TaxID=3157224 RepID=UPI00343C5BE2
MHDPSTLLFDVRPLRLDIWHDEPDGHDSGTVCGHIPMPVGARLLWAVRHARHLHYRFWPYLKVRRWIKDRCAECGRGFLWKDSRSGYMGSGEVYHSQCMTVRSLRGQLDDLTALVRFQADPNTKWRAEYRLELLAKREAGYDG